MRKRVHLYQNIFRDCLEFSSDLANNRLKLMTKKLWRTLRDFCVNRSFSSNLFNFLTGYFYMSRYPKECYTFSVTIARFGYIGRVFHWNELNRANMSDSYVKYSLWNNILSAAAGGGHIRSLKAFGRFVRCFSVPAGKEDWTDPLRSAASYGQLAVCSFILNSKYVSQGSLNCVQNKLCHCSDPKVIECFNLLQKKYEAIL